MMTAMRRMVVAMTDIRVCSRRSDDGFNFGKAENMVEGAYIGVERVICDKSDI